MAYIICEPCIGTKDTACVDACPVDCILPKRKNPISKLRPCFISIRRNVLIVARANQRVLSRRLHGPCRG